MGVFISDNKLLIMTEPKYIRIDLLIKINENLESNIEYIVRRKEYLTEYTIKLRLDNYC